MSVLDPVRECVVASVQGRPWPEHQLLYCNEMMALTCLCLKKRTPSELGCFSARRP